VKRLDGIDILRGTAVSAVILYHFYVLLGFTQTASFSYVKQFGSIGVPLFFVISGYLIFRSFEGSITQKGIKKGLLHYLFHRIFRIIPAYYFNLFIVLLIAAFFVSHAYYYSSSFFRQFLSHLTFTTFFVYKDTGFGINGAYWTLGIEMLWYIMVPVLYLFFNSLRALLIIALLSMLYLYGLDSHMLDPVLHMVPGSPDYHVLQYYYYFQIMGQINFFIAGILIYKYHNRIPEYSAWLAFLILFGFIGIMGYFSPALNFSFHLLLHLVVVSSLFILLYMRHLKWGTLLAWTGKISYSLYLWHMPVLYIMQKSDILKYRTVPETALIFLIILFAISSMSYYFIEEGGFALRKKLTQRFFENRSVSGVSG
jgi:peptidoglycan/LPS O-acetylase OafA/YrhL